MTLKVAYFQPIVIAMDNVPAVEFSQIFSLSETLHARRDLNDANNAISLRGGQQVQVYPNTIGIDVNWLIKWLETIATGYMELVSQQSGTDELKYCKPVVTSIWTIRQYEGQYQEMHSHPGGNLSGNMYITAPEFSQDKLPSDGQVNFRLPSTKDISKFIMTDTWKYDPQPGTVILFPSHLPHVVYPWKGAGHRTVMAFDAKLMPLEEVK